MQDSRDRQSKRRYRCIELRAVVSDHLITALHGADRRFEYRACLISKPLSWLQVWVFSNHTFTRDLLYFTVGIRRDPAAAKQARRDLTFVADSNCAGKDVFVFFRFALIVDVVGADVDSDTVAAGFVHAGILATRLRPCDRDRANPRHNVAA